MPGRRKRKFSNSSESQLDLTSRQKVHDIFEKKFTYSKPKENGWKLSCDFSEEHQSWEIPELVTLKTALNNLKDKLSDKDIVKWHQHTTFMNLAGNVNQELRRTIRPELCTQAWCKFYEIVSVYKLFDSNNEKLNSVHLCEAPGAFITSLNHFLCFGFKGEWNWLGSTLNPYYEGNSPSQMIDDDRFVRGSYGNWDFGADNTGDLMDWENLQQLRQRAENMGQIQLVTADGSIDCQGQPAEQEKVVSKLHICEALAAILILSPGGSLVLKKFTMFECDTICLMFLLNCLFSEVNVFKPATSKSGNSEVYVICFDFKGMGERRTEIENLCRKYFNSKETALSDPLCMFRRDDIPNGFLEQHIACCRYFTALQQDTIENNLIFYNNMSEDYMERVHNMKNYCTDMYFSKYSVQAIPAYVKITIPKAQKRQYFGKPKGKETKRNEGTYNDRVKCRGLPWQQRILQYDTYDVDHDLVEWFENQQPCTEEIVSDWICVKGKPVSQIKSSRFCDMKLVEEMDEILSNTNECQLQSPELATGGKTTAIIEATEVLMNQSPSSFPCHVTIVSSSVFEVEDIKQNKHIAEVCFVQEIENKTKEDTIIIIMDVEGNETNKSYQQTMLQYLLKMFKVLTKGNSIMIQIDSCLTRFSAGLIYLISFCFEKIGFLPKPGKSSGLQMLICSKYTGVSHFLLQHCCHLVDDFCLKDDNSDSILLETVPILTLIEDVDFVNFLTKCNEILLKSYITDTVQQIKKQQSLPNQT